MAVGFDDGFQVLTGIIGLIVVATVIFSASAANGFSNNGVNLGALTILILGFVSVGFAIKIFQKAYNG